MRAQMATFLLLASALGLFSAPQGAAGQEVVYQAVDLGKGIYPEAINNELQVVGSRSIPCEEWLGRQAFVWEKGELENILGVAHKESSAIDINDSGNVVGFFFPDWNELRPFSLIDGVLDTDILDVRGRMNSITEGNVIAGQHHGAPVTHGAVWDGDEVTILDWCSIPEKITENGDIGGIFFDLPPWRAVREFDGERVTLPGFQNHRTDLNDMNEFGLAVGNYADSNNEREGCFWTADGLLQPLTGWYSAEGVNDHGQIVGRGPIVPGLDSYNPQALLWDGTKTVPLNSLIEEGTGWFFEEAVAINDRGDIVGEGRLDGENRGFLLRRYIKVFIEFDPQPWTIEIRELPSDMTFYVKFWGDELVLAEEGDWVSRPHRSGPFRASQGSPPTVPLPPDLQLHYGQLYVQVEDADTGRQSQKVDFRVRADSPKGPR